MENSSTLLLLSKLSPAHSLYLLKPESTLRELLTYTLMDLILQERLHLVNFDPKPVLGNTRLGFAAVVPGKKFQQEKAFLHEMIFLFPFYRKPDSRIVMRHLMQMGLNTSRSEVNFKTKLLMDLVEMKPFFTKNLLQKIFGGQHMTTAGKEIQATLVKQFNALDKELPELLKTDRERASGILQQIKGNVILMNSFKFDLIPMIGEELHNLEEEVEGA